MHILQVTLSLPLVPIGHLSISLLLYHLEFDLSLPLQQCRHLAFSASQRLNTLVKLVYLC